MSRLNSPMEIFKLLEKSNCGKCNLPTCLAFAAAVFRGQKQLCECPRLGQDIIEKFGGSREDRLIPEQELKETVEELKQGLASVDLASAAERLGAAFSGNRLTLKVLGKDFHVDSKGNLSSEIHIHPWVIIPILSYIIKGAGIPLSGRWVPFRELKSGMIWSSLFRQRCEKPLKRVADACIDLFEKMIHVFNGREVENHFYHADISLVLHPLPRVPMLIRYLKPEDGLDSTLKIFFDSTAEQNLNIEGLYALGTGLATMFEKIALRHGFPHDESPGARLR